MKTFILRSTAIAFLGVVAAAQQERQPLQATEANQGPELPLEERPLRPCGLPPSTEKAVPQVWPDGIVYFEFDSNVSAAEKRLMYAAMDEWMYNTENPEITFVPRNPLANPDYLHIEDGDENFSTSTGYRAGQTTIEIFNWTVHSILVHELGHAIGFPHEQGRPDRDSFVSIITSNIESGKASQFTIREWFSSWAETPYDYFSIMHYPQCAFTKCGSCSPGCATIVPHLVPSNLIGQATNLSALDALDASNAYGSRPAAEAPRYVDLRLSVNLGTLKDPYNQLQLAASAPEGATVFVKSGTYTGVQVLGNKRVTLKAAGGSVRIEG